jgi:hypothetical protein
MQIGDHPGQHLDQLLFLTADVVGKERSRFRRDLEEPGVEQGCGLIGDRNDGFEARLDKRNPGRTYSALRFAPGKRVRVALIQMAAIFIVDEDE